MLDKNIPGQTSMYDLEALKRTRASSRNEAPSIPSKKHDIIDLISHYSGKGSVAFKSTSSLETINRIRKDLRRSLPSSFVYSTALLYREIKNEATKGKWGVLEIPQYNRDFKVSVPYVVDLSNAGKEKLNAFDFLVHDYIFTLYSEDYRYITLNNFVKMVWGKDNSSRYNPPKELTQNVIRSLIKLNRSRLEIYAEEQFETYTFPSHTPSTFIGPMIDIAFLDVPYGRAKQCVIELLDRPVFLSYSLPIKQLASFHRDLLHLGFRRQNLDKILIAHYLIRDITYMKSSNKNGSGRRARHPSILFKTLIERSNLSSSFEDLLIDSRKRKGYVEAIMEILAGFEKKGFVLGFEKVGSRIDISFNIDIEELHKK